VGGDGTAIATATLADGQTYDVIVVYDKGAGLAAPPADGSPQFAADIRIGMFFHYLAQPVLNQNGWALVEAAVNYALGITERAAVAKNPQPADGATDVPRDVILNWKPGDFAPASNAHRVFFSELFTDVDDGLGGIAQDANSYGPGGLDFETTYYWRVDEVNAPPDSTVHRGAVWSFTTEPLGYPIENVTVTASSFNRDDEKPENAINGSGLDEDDLHSSDGTTMWLSDVMDPNIAWIQFEFDKSYKLYQMLVWNYNSTVEPAVGFGIKEATIEYSVDGVNWSALGTAHEFAQGPGEAGYANDTTVDFLGLIARYVRITANSNWSPWGLTQYGLSEVRLLYTPLRAREPSPDSGATDVPVGGIISFRAGREAARHDLYLSTDEQSVIYGASPVTTVTEPSYAASLDLASTYYWRIDEVNEAETPSTWQGDLWDFATQEYIVVDGFEDYNDWPPHEIYTTWADGYEDPANGSQVGNLTPPFAEPGIVHGGMQSMPLFYDNTGGAAFSEATRTFAAGQDWTKHGIKTLSLWFYGAGGNTGQLYVKINGVKIPYEGDAGNLAAGFWLPWNIDLTSAGLNVQTVTTLAVGIDGNAAVGALYFDDIRLYAYDRQFITPAEPDNAGLVGHYKLDQDASDSSGNNHGTLAGNLQWAPGKIGGALSVVGTGVGDHVEIPMAGVSVSAGTIAMWAKLAPDPQVPATRYFFGHTVGPGWSNRIQLYMDDSDTVLDLGLGDSHNTYKNIITLATDIWYHIALTWDGSNYTVYVNGAAMANGSYTGLDALSTAADIGNDGNAGGRSEAFNGLLDDVRIYSRVLSTAEIAGLAGWTKPFDKPF
ncbi:MAG: LamG-like jellyroll fold domain-containing protein, partial [Planctomycetota bacterium]